MADNTYGSKSLLETSLASIIDKATLDALLTAIGAKGGYNVTITDGDTTTTLTDPPPDLVLVNNAADLISALEGATTDADGAYSNIGNLADFITNSSDTPTTIAAVGSAFIELQGPATVTGQDAPVFIVDAKHDTGDVNITASSQTSFIIGSDGPGSDTLTGSTSSTGHALLVAQSANTTMTGGAGADTLIGGGHTTMTGGTGAGQLLYEFSPTANDSITAGTGGFEKLSVAGGTNTINDGPGHGDTVFGGSGQDTIYGSTDAKGTTIALYQGNSSVVSATSDNIFIDAGLHGDTISAGSGTDNITFNGYTDAQVAAAVAAGTTSGDSVTINFASVGGAAQTATLNGVSHISFHGGSK